MNTFTPNANAFRFYQDGTESGSTPLAAENTNITVDVDPGNQQVHLRYLVQETGAASGATTDDYRLQVDSNGAGTWAITVNGATAKVQCDTASSLTDGGATTNRATNGITDGTGSFVAGEQEEANGTLEDHQLTASNFTEHVWGLLIIAADVSNNETLDFRMTLNGGSPGMTNGVTPRITIQKTPPATVLKDPITKGGGVIPWSR